MRLCLGIIPEAIPNKVSGIWPSKHEVNKEDTNRHAKVDGGKPIRHQSYKKNIRQLRKGRSEEAFFQRQTHTYRLSSANRSARKPYMQ